MRRKLALSFLFAFLLILGAIIAYSLLPKHYQVGERLSQTTVFWNDKEALVFLNVMAMGRTQNAVDAKIAASRYGWLMALAGMDFHEVQLKAFHLQASGKLEQPTLPENTSYLGSWGLVDGKLQLTTLTNHYNNVNGFRWDGTRFQAVAPQPKSLEGHGETTRNLSEDDFDRETDSSASGFLEPEERKRFKHAGWHYKFLTGYEANGTNAILPITIGHSKFSLNLQSTNWQNSPGKVFDYLAGGTSGIAISGGPLADNVPLWEQNGWQGVQKADYDRRVGRTMRRTPLPSGLWVWVVVGLFLMAWKFWVWGRLFFSLVTMKGRVVRSVPTAFSYPPASPAQFPLLDVASLDRYTREFENMGFSRLLDTSPTSNSATVPASFRRIMVHSGHSCFVDITQIFSRRKPPMLMKCSIGSHLTEGWSMGCSDRKPLPGSILIRRPKAIAVSMPEAKPAELLQSLLSLRQQVCLDLGLSPLAADTLESYIARSQQAAADMRAAAQRKNILTVLPLYYSRKLGLIRTKPEYVWFGDYPKLAEQRKRGYVLTPVT